MENKPVPAASGAEADIYESVFLGRPAVVKVRSPKAYRNQELDRKIRSSRIRSEARLIRDVRKFGVRTPVIYDVDLTECSITMEKIHGTKVKDLLDSEPGKADEICAAIGETVAAMHNARVSHGDLTTSNMIMTQNGEICLIDFSMGTSSADIEDMGVDIRLLERAFSSAHPGMERQYGILMESYCRIKTGSAEIMDKVREIKDRGRYT